ncbi:hypothetical protein ACQUQU_17725 [Thalassolituus sp. LLYu03]|uniref:hypothetical protein n=1 Tax=Thalassolituus sp. LLYu03 TaxID=3421656 RepID=UPI003D280DA1
MLKKTIKITFFLYSALSCFSVSADDLSVPHTFSPGTTIKSSEMNENFSTITSSLNQQSQVATSINTGISDLKQSTDSNGLTLDDINTILNSVDELLTSIDTKLTTTSPATITDQLVCVVWHYWPTDGSSYGCVQTSNPSNVRYLTFSQVSQEGWRVSAIGGGWWQW